MPVKRLFITITVLFNLLIPFVVQAQQMERPIVRLIYFLPSDATTPAARHDISPLTVDVNGDGVVNIQDLVMVSSQLGQAGKNENFHAFQERLQA